MDQKDLTILIPTLNEEKNIKTLCDLILQNIPNAKILVIDDGSTDSTQDIVRTYGPPVKLLDRSKEDIKGLSISIRDGILHCKTKIFMVIDGDLQHPPDSLLDALDCFKLGAELVIGYRIKVEDWPISRKLLSWGARSLGLVSLKLRFRQVPKDIMSGFFGGQIEVILPILAKDKISHKGYKLLFDILKILPRNIKIEQFGYVFRNREHGTSKIGKKQIWEYFKSIF